MAGSARDGPSVSSLVKPECQEGESGLLNISSSAFFPGGGERHSSLDMSEITFLFIFKCV